MNSNTLFYATDMDIYDALYAAKLRVTEGVLHDMLRARGILLSEATPREELISYLSSLLHDYHDFSYLMDYITSTSRSEKKTSTSLQTEINTSEITNAFDALKVAREDRNESYSHSVNNNKHIIKVNYTEIDHSKTRLRQRTQKEAIIEIDTSEGVTKLRHPANDRVNEIVGLIINDIEAQKEELVEKQNIDFRGINSHTVRSNFFKKLIERIPDYTPRDVKKIKVNHTTDTDFSIEDDDNHHSEPHLSVEHEMVGIVENALLKGESLLASREFQTLSQNGFFISHIRWVAEKQTTPKQKIEFEALFHDTSNCSEFRYTVLGFYTEVESGYTKHMKPLQEHEKTPYLKLIEDTAQSIYLEILAEQLNE